MRRARLVRSHILGGYDGVECNREAALREGDDVAIAVCQERKLSTLPAPLVKRRTDIRKRRPVGNGGDEDGGVIRFQVKREVSGRPPYGLGQDCPVAAKRSLAFDLSLDRRVGVQELGAMAGKQELSRCPDAMAPVDQRAKTVEGQPAVGQVSEPPRGTRASTW